MNLGAEILGYRQGRPGLSNADGDNPVSVDLAAGMASRMQVPLREDAPAGQTCGTAFVRLTHEFLQEAFALLVHLRPGEWRWEIGGQIAAFAQYEHLQRLERLLSLDPDLKTALGSDHLISPDIVVSRMPILDQALNSRSPVVDDTVARLTPLRAGNPSNAPLLHASIACKWSIRSDRVQTSRSEALNLIRSRKGHLPHVVFVTAEPLPSRLASIALGTGDLDCCYHAALTELLSAADASPHRDAMELLRIMVEGRRIRDIADLPLDLAC